MKIKMNALETLTTVNDSLIPLVFQYQNMTVDTPYYGSFIIPEKGFNETGVDGDWVDSLLSAYYNPKSCYYEKEELLDRSELLMDVILLEQHSDGTLDLKETNFHDATYSSFIIQVLAYTYRLLCAHSKQSEKEKRLEEKLLLFLERASSALLTGGFHTPNHRWVVASALSLCWSILKNEDLKAMAERYLAEGIDCDENGEYTERSTGIYNVINNRSLFMVAQELALPSLYEPITRNLEMMYYYFEPDETLFTLNSTRQDNSTAPYPYAYLDNYLFMAVQANNSQFAFVANKILKKTEACANSSLSAYELYKTIGNHTCLTRIMLQKEFQVIEATTKQIPVTYHHFFEESQIIRSRKDQVSYTVLANNPTFFVYQRGRNQLQARFASSFFSKGIFVSPTIQRTETGYLLEYHSFGDYKRPFASPPPTSNWHEMDHASRKIVNRVDLLLQVHIEEKSDGVSLRFISTGVPYLPLKMEFVFLPGGEYITEHEVILTQPNTSAILKEGAAKYRLKGDTITLAGGRGEHWYTSNMRGTHPPLPERFTLYLTAMGEIDHTVRID